MKKIFFITLLFVSITNTSHSQAVNKKFGKVLPKDFVFPSSIRDSTAGAVFLIDEGLSTYDYSFEVVFTYHARILILNSSEFDRAEIEIPHAAKGYSTKVKASAFNLVSGKIVESEVKRRDIYTEKVTDDLHKEVFTIPNVKEGSIIEYTYTVSQGSFRSLNTWYFQNDVPVVYSEYRVEMPEFFIYKQTLTGFLTVSDYDTYLKNGEVRSQNYSIAVKKFVMLNVPAFVSEPFMKSRKDNISSVRFEMESFQFPGAITEIVAPSNYAQLSRTLANNTYYESIYKRNGFYNDLIEEITNGVSDSLEKAKIIYTYLQEEFEVDDEMTTSNFKQIFKEKKGWAQDINMVFAGILHNMGFKVELVRVSTKKNGIPNPSYATVKNFNYTVCLVTINGEEYLLDAAVDHLPFGSMVPRSVNGKGLVISSEAPRWVPLSYGNKASFKCSANIELDDKGGLIGEIESFRVGYSAFHFKNEYLPNTIDKYKEEVSENNPAWIIDEHQVEVSEERISEKLAFISEPEFNESLDDIYFKPVFYQRTTNNPFKLENRKFTVSLNEPAYEALIYKVNIPEGFEVVTLPENVSLKIPGDKCSYLYSCSIVNNVISLTSLFKVNDTEFNKTEYLYLKEFWAQVVEKQSEEIHLRRKAN